ncbi:hypothetical protein [Actinoplanes friuliensis]|uniref:Uncharacterized protein n=1 Tax=Actinoplanes friuliensis DSM 7358 TaxID=1246995 RepID=U5VY74_9ACTN|nr:hypothetical protein [Actinoplanes friuliensis]AGZ41732.1 hypothetical protein AFR_17270 [Actinoplanes friuliensis DSM 7358]
MSVLAHGIGQSQDLPLPLDLVLQAGAATVVLSFLVSAVLWQRPRLGAAVRRAVRSTWWRLPLQVVVLVLSLYLVVNAFTGSRGPENPVTRALFVWLWVGLVPVSVVLGPVWRIVNPLRTLFRLLRLPAAGLRPVPGEKSAGRLPAAVWLLVFVWFELVSPGRTDPVVIGCALLGYALVQLAFATVRGEEWFARGDCFEVYSELAGRLSPLRWRNPLAAVANTPRDRGLAVFLAVWWGSTIFDSASSSPAWDDFLDRAGNPLLYGTAGLVLLCAGVLASVRWMAGRLDVTASLIPIAVGYTVAHYLTLLLTEGPAPGLIAGLQITLILLGHLLAVLIAHDMALAAGPARPVLATLADELPVVLLMIAYTWAGLFLLFVR